MAHERRVMKTKVCTKCGEEKPLSEYNKDSRGRGKYGLIAQCKVCVNNYNKERRKDPTYKAREVKYTMGWIARNPEKFAKHQKKYRIVHKEEIKERRDRKYHQDYQRDNKDKISHQHKANSKKYRDELADIYIIRTLTQKTGITTKDIRQHPSFIETKRLQLLIRREIKNQNHEKHC